MNGYRTKSQVLAEWCINHREEIDELTQAAANARHGGPKVSMTAREFALKETGAGQAYVAYAISLVNADRTDLLQQVASGALSMDDAVAAHRRGARAQQTLGDEILELSDQLAEMAKRLEQLSRQVGK